jgi:hypothetical protein
VRLNLRNLIGILRSLADGNPPVKSVLIVGLDGEKSIYLFVRYSA